MADAEIAITGLDSDLRPGIPTSTPLAVRNSGTEVETFRFEIAAAMQPWTELSEDVLRIYPGESAQISLTILAPRGPGLPAGDHVVLVDIRADEGSHWVARLPMTVSEFVSVDEPLLAPDSLETARQGQVAITTSNLGNTPVAVEVAADDAAGALTFQPARSTQTCVVGGSVRFDVTVACRHRRFWASPAVHPYSVTVVAGQQKVLLKGKVLQGRTVSCLPILLVLMAIGLGLTGVASLLFAGGLLVQANLWALVPLILAAALLTLAVVIFVAARRRMRRW